MDAVADDGAHAAALERLLAETEEALRLSQPEMGVRVENGLVIAEGDFLVRVDGCPDDRFAVRVEIDWRFPDMEPRVFETAGRIPRTADRHMYDGSGACCTGVYEEWLVEVETPSVSSFLEGPVDRFLVGQTYFELTETVEGEGKWPFGERSHGVLGILEGCAIALGIDLDPDDITPLIDHLRLLERKSIKGHVRCPCGSGRRLRDCHSERMRRLQVEVPPRLAHRMLARILGELRRLRQANSSLAL